MNDMLNIHDKHMTNINSNKFILWMYPLILEKFRSIFENKENWFDSLKRNQICFCLDKIKKKKKFCKENQICFGAKLKKKKKKGDF